MWPVGLKKPIPGLESGFRTELKLYKYSEDLESEYDLEFRVLTLFNLKSAFVKQKMVW
jgi:hypothetical protein